MGEEMASVSPFLFFTDHNPDLARAVRDSRRREFAAFEKFSDPEYLAKIPDPNALETFERSKPAPDPSHATEREELYRHLLALRRNEIVPRLDGARAADASAMGPAAILARWRMGDGSTLIIASNFDAKPVHIPPQRHRLLFAGSQTAGRSVEAGVLAPYSTVVLLAFS
jgi:maltooligosyltrehalose trehalohydrolase